MTIHVERHSSQLTNSQSANLVLLHGWGASSEIWRPWLPFLTTKYSVTLIDIPGLGRSSLVEEYSLDNVLEAMTPAIPMHSILIGWSLGGLLSILLAEKLKEKISAVITITSNPCFIQRNDWVDGMEYNVFQQFQKGLLENEKKTMSRFNMLQVKGGRESKSILNVLKKITCPKSDLNLSASLALLNVDAREVLQGLTIPSLHVLSERDQLVPFSLADKLPQLSEFISVCKVMEAGHLPFLSDMELLSEKVDNFICANVSK